MRRVALAILILAFAACSSDERVVLAAGTTLVDSGFIDRVLEEYPGETPSVVAVSSREALALGSSGSAGLLITHLPGAEDEFLNDHPGAVQEPVFISQFVLVGPKTGPLAPRPGGDPLEQFAMIAREEHPFVSRGDGSGTASKEDELWRLAGIDPSGEPWYTETGQGMGFTLQVADQREAYTLAEVGAFHAVEAITLVPLTAGPHDHRLDNPYRMTLVDGAGPATRELFDWLGSEQGKAAVEAANLELFDGLIYVPCGPERRCS